jgi:hypothetical protein
MTPFDWASLSLNGSELPPPTVGGSPLTSGGQVAPLSGGGVAVDCASDTFAVTTVTNAAMIGTTERKATLPDLHLRERIGQRAQPLKCSHGIGRRERGHRSLPRSCSASRFTAAQAGVLRLEPIRRGAGGDRRVLCLLPVWRRESAASTIECAAIESVASVAPATIQTEKRPVDCHAADRRDAQVRITLSTSASFGSLSPARPALCRKAP